MNTITQLILVVTFVKVCVRNLKIVFHFLLTVLLESYIDIQIMIKNVV